MAKKSNTRSKPKKRPERVLKVLRKYGLPADFPLSPHFPSERWYKTRSRRTYYFGPLDNPQGALDYYHEQYSNFTAGRDLTPPGEADARLDVGTLVNAYIEAAAQRLEAGELKQATFDYYRAVGSEIVSEFGRHRATEDLRPADFGGLRVRFAKRFGPTEVSKRIQVVRSAFKYAYDAELLDRPQRFGPDFKKPSKTVLRKNRRSKARRMFEADDLRKIIDAADVPLKAMVLLGINCGWGNTDISELPIAALDLHRGFADFPRPKAGIEREAALWPETVDALRAALDKRPEPKSGDDAGLVFITKYGRRFVRYRPSRDASKSGAWIDGVRLQFNKTLKALDLHEPGVSFYALRHTFQTAAEGCGDLPAVTRIMGHNDESMAERYRERIEFDRLKAVADHVHAWLWPAKKGGVKKKRS